MLRFKGIVGLVLIFSCWCWSVLAQDQFITEDGEILKGKIISSENGEIVIQSNTFGEIRVSADKGKVVAGGGDPQGMPSTTTHHNSTTIPGAVGKVDDGGDPEGAEIRENTRRMLKLPEGLHLEAGVGVGYLEGENHGENYSLSLDVAYDRGRYFNSLGGQYLYGQVEGRRNTDEWEYKARTVRYFGDLEHMKYFSLFQGSVGSNRIQLEDRDKDLYAGLGSDLIKNDKVQLRAAVGYSSEWEDFMGLPSAGVPDLPTIHRNKAFLYQDLKFRLGERLELQQSGFYMLVLDDTSLYDFKINSTLSYKLTTHLSLDVNYTYEFDNSSALGIEEDTSKLTLQLAYKL